MHRIDVPSATVDHKFTEGSPAGGVPATTVSADWLNDLQENIMAVLTAGGVPGTKGRAADLLDALRGISGAATGTTRNAKISIPAASSSATFTAYEVSVSAGAGGATYRLSGVVVAVNLAAVGVGGMDVGSPPANGYVALYVIHNPTNGSVQMLAKNATAGVQTMTYTGANMPAGFTASALVAVLPTNGSGQFKAAKVQGNKHFIPLATAYTGTTNVTSTPVSISGIVPPNAIEIFGEIGLLSSTASNLTLSVYSGPSLVGQQNGSANLAAGAGSVGNFANIALDTAQQIVVTATTSGAGPTFSVYISGYVI